jgi:uncharacterized membrane protein YphA (DoxX/SURF4 family)
MRHSNHAAKAAFTLIGKGLRGRCSPAHAMSAFWQSVFRIGVGFFWLFFAYQNWTGHGVSPAAVQSGFLTNPVPGIHEVLVTVVLPNFTWFSLVQTAGEVAVGGLLIVGLFTRPAAIVGSALAIYLALTVAFVEPSIVNRWVYYLLVLGNLELAFNGPGALSIDNRGVA